MRRRRKTITTAWLVSLLVAFQTSAEESFEPVTDAMLADPAPGDWLSWRRTAAGWGYSPLDQINRTNVSSLRLAWTRGLHAGSQTATPLAYDGVLYMPNPNDVIQALDGATGDLLWEHRRAVPDDFRGLLHATSSASGATAVSTSIRSKGWSIGNNREFSRHDARDPTEFQQQLVRLRARLTEPGRVGACYGENAPMAIDRSASSSTGSGASAAG